MPRWLPVAVLLAVLLVSPLASHAHHGWSGYDISQEFAVTGVIEKMTYDYPHVTIWLNPGDGGAKKKWTCVLAPPSRAENRGATAELLKPGATVKLVGYPNRADPTEMRAERIFIGDKKVELR